MNMKNEMSPAMKAKLEAADKVNPGLFRVFRAKRPGLYIAHAKRIIFDSAVDNLRQARKLN